jgi:site-specific DNA-methyltransferase (adenine-specific)
MKSISDFLDHVIHGDCVAVMHCMPSESVDLVVTDPPYLVNYRPRDGRRCEGDDNASWLLPSFRELYRVLKPDRFCATFYGWPWIDKFMQAWRLSGFRPVSHLVWVKSHCSREGYTRSYHEVGFLLAKGKPPRSAEPPTDVLPWYYTANKLHPNQKPVIAIEPIIKAYSKPGDVVLDPFAGAGTTGLAATACGRHFILIEKVDHHCKTARARLSQTLSFAHLQLAGAP